MRVALLPQRVELFTRRALERCASWRLAAKRDERGSSTVEFAILFPIIVVLLFAGPQLAMWYFAREAAEAAGAAAARAASVDGAATDAGTSAGQTYLAKLGSETITSYEVSETQTATQVIIRVHAAVPRVVPLPGFTPVVDITIRRDKERFTTPESR